jgi:hypothetical protein
MKKISMTMLAAALMLLPMPRTVSQQKANQSFGFNAASIKGFPTGQAFLTGGGAYDPNPEAAFVRAGGGFRCLAAIEQLPLKGCKAGEGIRWDAVELLSSVPFKCTGALGESPKTAVTDGNMVVIVADFYRQGDGVNESFTAKMFVSAVDEDPDRPGIQNVWIQGVGCGDAIVNFN